MAELELYKCKTCGEPLDIRNIKDGVLECKYCGNVYTVPKEETNPAALSFLRMGEHDLDVCKFDEAFEAYKKAAELDKNEPEAYWGMALSKFKVQYLKDEVNNRLQPICHEVTENKFTDDSDYMRAFTKATPNQREEYEKRAKDIDYIQSEFCKLEKTGLDYDCFICVKVTGENGETTEDSKDADYIYRLLNDKGYKPFYSEYEIRNKQGADYEAHILYALYKSECMLVVCRNEDFLKTKWVKNEYMRFLKLVNDEEKESDSITFVYYKKAIEKLPGKKGKIQGIDFSRRSADGQIIDFVERHTPEAKRKREEAAAAKLRREEENQKRYAEQQRIIEERQKAFEEQQRIEREETEKRRRALEEQQRQLAEQLERMQQASAERERKEREEEERIALEKAAAERRAREEAERKAREESVRIAKEESERRGKEETERKAREERVAKENWIKENDPTISCYNADEFEIDGTVLKKYKGDKANVKVPSGVTSIGVRAFLNCTSLTSITIGNGLTSIGKEAFYGCNNLKKVYITDITAWCNIHFDGYFANPLISAHNLYLEGQLVTNLDIPQGVTKIKSHAFAGFGGASITIPDSVTSIGVEAFSGCTAEIKWRDKPSIKEISFNVFGSAFIGIFRGYLGTNLTIPNSVTSIGGYAFKDCTNLTSITIPNSVTSIGGCAFHGCTSLKEITIPDSVTSIGECAFIGCTAEINWGDKPAINEIKHSFWGYEGKKLTIPNSVTSIGVCAFKDCTAEIKWGDNPSIKEIEQYAFSGYKGTKISIPDSVTSIADGAFAGCTSLESVTIGNSVTSIGNGAFSGCTSLTEITIPESVISIGDRAFNGCTNLTSITIPNSVTSIGDWAFNGCTSLTEITIPESVISIGDRAFNGCTSIKIYCKSRKNQKNWYETWNIIEDGNIFTTKRAKVVWGYKGK